MFHMQKTSSIEPPDLDLSPSPGVEYRVIKMEEDVRSALLSRYYKESKFNLFTSLFEYYSHGIFVYDVTNLYIY